MCSTGKACHRTRVAANREANDARRRDRNKRGPGLRVYRCEECGQYHVTHQTKARAARSQVVR